MSHGANQGDFLLPDLVGYRSHFPHVPCLFGSHQPFGACWQSGNQKTVMGTANTLQPSLPCSLFHWLPYKAYFKPNISRARNAPVVASVGFCVPVGATLVPSHFRLSLSAETILVLLSVHCSDSPFRQQREKCKCLK